MLHYGQPIDISRWYDQRLTQDILREVTDELMNRLAELGGVKPPPVVSEDESESPSRNAFENTVNAEHSE